MSDTSVSVVDVVVVGGGPAGSATALWCVRQGLRVALVERERFPRHRPGETLPPGAEPLFRQLGVADAVDAAGFTRHAGTWVSWSGPRRFDAFGAGDDGPWLGYQAPRDHLDGILLDTARAAGVEIHHPERATTSLLRDGRVVGVSAGSTRISAAWVVDAGGGQHWLARSLGIPRRLVTPRLIARYGYGREACLGSEAMPEIIADEAGWTWTAPISPGVRHWTRLSFAPDDPRRDQPPAGFDQAFTLDPPRGADVTWRIVERPAGPGYLCVGDAAAVLDPASSHGVLKALMSGMMAAHVIGRHARGRASEADAIRSYGEWVAEFFRADATKLLNLYRSHPHPPRWATAEAHAVISARRVTDDVVEQS